MNAAPSPADSQPVVNAPVDALRSGLEALFGDLREGHGVRDLKPLSGHAGVGFAFVVQRNEGLEKFVVRTLAADGPATGPSDVVRQARIMKSLEGSGIPVPGILSYGQALPVLNRPYFVAEFVHGTAMPQRKAEHAPAHAALARRGVEVMARLHEVPSARLTNVWGAPREVAEEVARLHKLIDRPTVDQANAALLEGLRERLLQTAPDNFGIGCIHGDLHFGNMIFGPEEVRALVDWEIASISSPLLDLGMLAFYADPDAALPEHRYRAERWVLEPDEIIDIYRAARGHAIAAADITWHRALAGYRFGAITLFNEMLHRRGKKHDPMWADVIHSVPTMVDRSLALLAGASTMSRG